MINAEKAIQHLNYTMVIFKHIFILTYMKAVNLCCADEKTTTVRDSST